MLGVGAVRERPLLRAAAVLAAALLAACSLPGGASRDVGYLEGRATVGPLTPVERIGVPPPTPTPEVCTAVGLRIFHADGRTEAASIQLQPDCTYRLALSAGSYVVRLKQANSVQSSKDLPATVRIERGETSRLDFAVDTGIR